MGATFRSLRHHNYRLWTSGALVSNIGTWLQRTAQDWLVMVELTHHDATAVGLVMALQFGPQALLMPITGMAADRFDRRKLLCVTQAALGVLALGLGVLTVTGMVRLWHVYVFALLLGVVAAFDTPARQVFASNLVPDEDISNAIALNSALFNAARLVGPAAAGLLIAAVGTGWAFILNGLSFGGVLIAMSFMRIADLRSSHPHAVRRTRLIDGFRYLGARRDLQTILLMVFMIGTFGLNYPIFIAAMSVNEFHKGSGQFGLLSSILAVGSVTGALFSAGRLSPRLKFLLIGSGVFGLGSLIAAWMPNYLLFGLALISVGFSAQIFNTTANAYIQSHSDPSMRGRVMAIMLALSQGGTPLGAPIVGWVADHFGARWSTSVAAAAGLSAAAIVSAFMARTRSEAAKP